MSSAIQLSPAQQEPFDWFVRSWKRSPILHFWSNDGFGRSTVLRALHQKMGGVMLGLKEFVEASQSLHPLNLEDALYQIVIKALSKNNVVFVDDWHVATSSFSGCGGAYPRSGYIDSPAGAIAKYVADADKKLVIATDGSLQSALSERALAYGISPFEAVDYQFLCSHFGDPKFAAQVEFEKVHRYAPRLTAHQLKWASLYRLNKPEASTETFIEYLRTQQLTSNVELGEVSKVSLEELRGVDDVIESLMANIVMPFENDEIASSIGLKPKRGVLLAGPPGTGKTTVGRALAHRLKGKFFLIDGTIISGTGDFYSMIHRVFREATDNAPSVIFIDDSDVIFESGQEHGLYRYLLTMLDGLESKSVGRVCVILTAMDVGNLPPALVRSGRIELWLDMRYPDLQARVEILASQVASLPEPLNRIDVESVALAAEGQSGADLKRILEEGKAYYAYDLVKHGSAKDVTSYMLAAIESVNSAKKKYANAEMRANANRTARPTWFNPDLHAAYMPSEE